MAVLRAYETISHSPLYSMGAIDLFADARTSKPPKPQTGSPVSPVIPPLLGEFHFFVSERLTPPTAAYDPPHEFISWTNRSGFFLFSGETRTPDRVGTLALSPGRYHWQVESDYYQLVEFEDVWPPTTTYDSAKDLKLLPGPNYPFPDLNLKQREVVLTLLRGTLLDPAGQPVEKVKVGLTAPVLPTSFVAFKECLTNKRGEWVLAFIEKKQKDEMLVPPNFPHSKLHVSLPGNDYAVDLSITPGAENSLRQTALRGRVIKPGGVPVSGAKITTSVGAGESVSRVDGQWFFYFELREKGGPVTITATTSDGRTGSKESEIVPRSAVVVEPIEIS